MMQVAPLISYQGHMGVVNMLSWSPDGKHIASASNDTTVQIWNATTGELIQIYRGHREPVEAVYWSPQGDLVASGGWDKKVCIWDAISAKDVYVYHEHSAWVRKALVWSPNGNEIASGAWDRTVRIWNVQNGETSYIYQDHESIVTSLAWSWNGLYIASGGGNPFPFVHVWEKSTGKTIAKYREFQYSIRALAWLKDNQTCLIGSYHEDIRLWKPFTNEVVMQYGYWLGNAHTGEGTRVADTNYCISNVTLSPNEKHIAAGVASNRVSVWNVNTGENVAIYPCYSQAVAWSPDGTRLACADSFRNTVSIWQWSIG